MEEEGQGRLAQPRLACLGCSIYDTKRLIYTLAIHVLEYTASSKPPQTQATNIKIQIQINTAIAVA